MCKYISSLGILKKPLRYKNVPYLTQSVSFADDYHHSPPTYTMLLFSLLEILLEFDLPRTLNMARKKNIGSKWTKFSWPNIFLSPPVQFARSYASLSVCSLLSVVWTGPKVIENNSVKIQLKKTIAVTAWAHCQRQVAFLYFFH